MENVDVERDKAKVGCREQTYYVDDADQEVRILHGLYRKKFSHILQSTEA